MNQETATFLDAPDQTRTILVLVNEKRVRLTGAIQTGHSIKAAAIAQGVPIQLDFILSIELGGGATKLVRDDEKVRVKEGERFLAIANDDNS